MTPNQGIPPESLFASETDVITFYARDPESDVSYLEFGIFPWELTKHGEPHDGIGLHIRYRGPTSDHHSTVGATRLIYDRHEVFSGGSKFRMENTTPDEVRETARVVAHYTFCYWWWLDETGYPLNKQRKRTHSRKPSIDAVEPDGSVYDQSGEAYTAPFTLDDITLTESSEWTTPTEHCTQAFNDVIRSLKEQYPDYALENGWRDADGLLTPLDPTDERRAENRLTEALDIEQVGHERRWSILREFESVEALCDDIETGGERLTRIPGIGDGVKNRVRYGLVENGYWNTSDDGDQGATA